MPMCVPPTVYYALAQLYATCERSDEARKYVPAGLKLVELGGWTLGGLYLARYKDSPAGVFDELVVLGGLVWNAPTSCAWASRVYVNSKSARNHGIRSVGLPSRLASFEQSDTEAEPAKRGLFGGLFSRRAAGPSWWNVDFARHRGGSAQCPVVIRNTERGRRGMKQPVAQLLLPESKKGWGPHVKLSLPSFSGATPEVPGLLQYACELRTNVKLLPKVRVVGDSDTTHAEDVSTILRGKPLICMGFDDMHMTVREPEPYLLPGSSKAVMV